MSQPQYTLHNGGFINAPQVTHRIGNTLHGPHLLQDIHLLETIEHVMHERIPERHVHAKGVGVHGEFEVTDSISELTDAKFLSEVGKKTPLFARFSTTAGEKGSADTVRDARGYAFKLYTEQGNLDWLFFSTPTFPIRDGGKFPSFTHCQKKDPETGFRSADNFWDFMSHNPETFNTLMMLFSDFGTPKTYRDADIFSVNAYKFIKGEKHVYVRIHMLPNKTPVETLTRQQAEQLAGQDPDYHSRDLYTQVAAGKNDPTKYPSWTVYAQIVEPSKVPTFPVNILDPTLRWPQGINGAPLRRFGKITLKDNPADVFGVTEQVSFSPAAIVPGWGLSADPILQTRLIAYGTAARYRLGANFQQLEVNKTQKSTAFSPTKRDGIGYVRSLDKGVRNYIVGDADAATGPIHHEEYMGKIMEHKSKPMDHNYSQAKELWLEFKQKRTDEAFVGNVGVNLKTASVAVRNRTYDVFNRIDAELGRRIKAAAEPSGGQGEGAFGLVPSNIGGIGG